MALYNSVYIVINSSLLKVPLDSFNFLNIKSIANRAVARLAAFLLKASTFILIGFSVLSTHVPY